MASCSIVFSVKCFIASNKSSLSTLAGNIWSLGVGLACILNSTVNSSLQDCLSWITVAIIGIRFWSGLDIKTSHISMSSACNSLKASFLLNFRTSCSSLFVSISEISSRLCCRICSPLVDKTMSSRIPSPVMSK